MLPLTGLQQYVCAHINDNLLQWGVREQGTLARRSTITGIVMMIDGHLPPTSRPSSNWSRTPFVRQRLRLRGARIYSQPLGICLPKSPYSHSMAVSLAVIFAGVARPCRPAHEIFCAADGELAANRGSGREATRITTHIDRGEMQITSCEFSDISRTFTAVQRQNSTVPTKMSASHPLPYHGSNVWLAHLVDAIVHMAARKTSG